MPGPRLVEPRLKACHLLASPDEQRAREQDTGAVGFIGYLARLDGRCDAFELQRTKVVEGKRLPAGEERLDDGAAENLAGLRAVAEPPRDDDRGAEVVVTFAHRLAGVDADLHGKPLAADAATRTLLHHDRAAHGVCRRGEGDHQAVAEGLHLRPAVRANGVA